MDRTGQIKKGLETRPPVRKRHPLTEHWSFSVGGREDVDRDIGRAAGLPNCQGLVIDMDKLSVFGRRLHFNRECRSLSFTEAFSLYGGSLNFAEARLAELYFDGSGTPHGKRITNRLIDVFQQLTHRPNDHLVWESTDSSGERHRDGARLQVAEVAAQLKTELLRSPRGVRTLARRADGILKEIEGELSASEPRIVEDGRGRAP